MLIATKHQKEQVISPLFQQGLGVTCVIAQNFDTDVFGTFCGKVERKADPLTTVRKKCLEAMAFSGHDLAIASEGSFGPHPQLFFLQADEEVLMLIDKKHNLEITVRELSADTNFGGEEIFNEMELLEFAERALFPSHGLIVRKPGSHNADAVKGITDWELLLDSFRSLQQKHGVVYVETDMRAMYNPTRMAVIEKAAQKLLQKVNSCCPKCDIPGFAVTEVTQGLPCDHCRFPTQSILGYKYTCQHCNFVQVENYPHQKATEDPMYCSLCNP
ncbi:DUF6671 family protein [Pontibacter sp. CAU 1760]